MMLAGRQSKWSCRIVLILSSSTLPVPNVLTLMEQRRPDSARLLDLKLQLYEKQKKTDEVKAKTVRAQTDLTAAIDLENRNQLLLGMTTKNLQEAIAARKEKRKPRYGDV